MDLQNLSDANPQMPLRRLWVSSFWNIFKRHTLVTISCCCFVVTHVYSHTCDTCSKAKKFKNLRKQVFILNEQHVFFFSLSLSSSAFNHNVTSLTGRILASDVTWQHDLQRGHSDVNALGTTFCTPSNPQNILII